MTRLEAIKYIGGRLGNLPKAVQAKITETTIRECGEDTRDFVEEGETGLYTLYETFLGTITETFFDTETSALTDAEANYLNILKVETYTMLSELHLSLKRYVQDSIFDKQVQFNSNEITPAYLEEVRSFSNFWINKASKYKDKIVFVGDDEEEEASTGSISVGAI